MKFNLTKPVRRPFRLDLLFMIFRCYNKGTAAIHAKYMLRVAKRCGLETL